MYVGVFDLRNRLEQTRKLLKDKIHLREMLEEDIKELEQSVKELESMLNKTEKTVLV